MPERKKHYAIFIPPRGERLEREALTPTVRPGQMDFDDAVFAEVEFEAGAFGPSSEETERRFFASIPESQPIGRPTADPVRQRVYEMRSLASGSPFGRNDPALFYRQAKFMEDFTDGYEGDAPFSKYYPAYQIMGFEQLRTYFTWRTRVRGGDIRRTSLSYVYLHIYELLSAVGADSPGDGLHKLTELWTAYRKWEPSLDQYLPRWLRDYHICYDLPYSGPETSAAAHSLTVWNMTSSYDVTKSKFYQAGNEELLRECFSAVLRAVRETGADLDKLLFTSATVPWRPFQRALAYCPAVQRDRRVEMPDGEVYVCKDNRWTADVLIRDTGNKDFAAYLIKKTEGCLREAEKYKFRLKAGTGEYDGVIERAVREFIAERNRTVVTVDHHNLTRIRKEAQGTQEKLTVEDGGPPPAAAGFTESSQTADIPLSVETEAIAALLGGEATLREFAGERGLMPEVLADGINEIAVDFFGDNLLDDEMLIYDEYIEKAKEMAGRAGGKRR